MNTGPFPYNFNDLPEEVKASLLRLSLAVKRVKKAEEQEALAGDEVRDAKAERMRAELEAGSVSLRWDPMTNTMSPKQEEGT